MPMANEGLPHRAHMFVWWSARSWWNLLVRERGEKLPGSHSNSQQAQEPTKAPSKILYPHGWLGPTRSRDALGARGSKRGKIPPAAASVVAAANETSAGSNGSQNGH